MNINYQELKANASFATTTTSVTANITLTDNDVIVLADANAGNITVILPTLATSSGRIYKIKKVDSSNNTVTVDGNGAETIDGDATQVIGFQYDAIQIQNYDTEWSII